LALFINFLYTSASSRPLVEVYFLLLSHPVSVEVWTSQVVNGQQMEVNKNPRDKNNAVRQVGVKYLEWCL
jgi:hypothetical protein